MLHTRRTVSVLRFLALTVVITFLPSSIGIWNFMPPAYAQEVSSETEQDSDFIPAQPIAPVPQAVEPDPVTLVDESTLEENRSLVPDIQSRLDMTDAKPFQLAMADIPALAGISNMVLGQTPTTNESKILYDGAMSKFQQGDERGGLVNLISLIDTYPRTADALQALTIIDRYTRDAFVGKIPLAKYDGLKGMLNELPTWENCKSPEGKYAIVGYYHAYGLAAKHLNKPVEARQYNDQVRTLAWRFMEEHPNHPLQLTVVSQLAEAAVNSGPDIARAEVQKLNDYVQTEGPCLARWVARKVVAQESLRTMNDQGTSYLSYTDLINEYESDYVQNCLTDPFVHDITKSWILVTMADAYYNLGRVEEALVLYRYIAANFRDANNPADSGAPYLIARYSIPFILHNNTQDYATAMATYDAYVNEFPDTPFAPRALFNIALVYHEHQDYVTAQEVYNEVITRYPDNPVANAAAHNIEYIRDSLYNNARFAKAPTSPDGEPLIQLCGPMALQAMLAMKGVDVELNQLTLASGTTSVGTSMKGLMDAARDSHFRLAGVKARNLDSLTAPFIAHVYDNHFVLVTDYTDTDLTIREYGLEPETMDRAKFDRIWKGKVLLPVQATALALNMDEQDLIQTMGGSGGFGGGIGGAILNNAACNNHDTGPDECPTRRSSGAGISPASYAISPARTHLGGNDVYPQVGVKSPIHSTVPSSPSSPVGSGYNKLSPRTPGVVGYQGSQSLYAKDLSFNVSGAMNINFGRSFHNVWGREKTFGAGGFTFGNNIGSSWFHSYNMRIHTSSTAAAGDSTAPDKVIYYNNQGSSKVYEYWTTWIGAQWYVPVTDQATSEEEANVLIRDVTSGEWTLVFGNNLKYNFSDTDIANSYIGLLTSIEDVSGNKIDVSLDTNGKIIKIDAPGTDTRHLAFEYSGNLMTKVSFKKDATTTLQSVTYEYSTAKDLTKVTLPDGTIETYAYDTNTAGTYSGVYHNAGEMFFMSSLTTNSLTTTYDYTFDEHSNPAYGLHPTKIVATLPNGLKSEYTRTIGSGISESYVENIYGTTVLSKIEIKPAQHGYFDSEHWFHRLDGSGGVDKMKFTYYDEGLDGNDTNDHRLYQVIYPYYGPSDPDNRVWVEYEYDTNGNVTKETFGSNPTTLYEYDSRNTVTKVTNPDGEITTYAYDTLHRLTKTLSPAMGPAGMEYFYDTKGRVTKTRDPLLNDTEYDYDTKGNLTQVINPMLQSTDYLYDDYGNSTKITDDNANITQYAYDTSGCGSCGGNSSVLTKITDANNKITTLYYDSANNLTKRTDPLLNDTVYAYDSLNRQTKVTSPELRITTTAYNNLGQVSSVTDPDSQVTSYVYDAMGRMIEVTDPIDKISYAYDDMGNQTKVTDGNLHSWTYEFDNESRLTKATDPISKVTKYWYDDLGRTTKVGAGASGTTDPTEYFYNATSGLLTKVQYDGNVNRVANYTYNDAAQLTKLTDWLDGTNGLQYTYDDVGRISTIKDYDSSVLDYDYDGVGNVTQMTDYHGNATSYTYTSLNQISTITAPGSKVWDYDYNDDGSVSQYGHPNSMTTVYSYDDDRALTKIAHKDGAAVKQSFDYALGSGGNITKTTHEDGALWDYLYDGRDRLTKAVRSNAASPNDTIKATYEYTYDDGDNMLTKVMPFADDFNDGNMTGWSYNATYWGASTNAAKNTPHTTWTNFNRATTDADLEMRFSYTNNNATTPASANQLSVSVREVDGNNKIYLTLREDGTWLNHKDGGVFSTLASNSGATSTADTLYHVRIVADGANIKVYRAEDGQLEQELFNVSTATMLTQGKVVFGVAPNAQFSVDNITVLADDMSSTTTMAYNNGNELTSLTDTNGTTAYSYDDWGRQISKVRGSQSATLTYGYGSKLTNYSSTFSGEGTVTYGYRGDHKRGKRTADGNELIYKWNWGWVNLNIENGTGTLLTTNIAASGTNETSRILAVVSGSNPATGEYNYLAVDNIRSTRSVFDSQKALIDKFDYLPYGGEDKFLGSGNIMQRFTGHTLDDKSDLYYAPYRFYNPNIAKWTTRDPLNMIDGPNMFNYVGAKPTKYWDLMGLDSPGCDGIPDIWEGPCTLECCAKHDKCYRDNGCAANSWLPRCGTPECNACNSAATDCFGDCDWRGGPDNPDIPNYYCAVHDLFFNDPESPHMGHSTG